MYGLEENEVVSKGKVIAVWSPVHRQGAVSANTALVSSFLACSAMDLNDRVLVMSNEMSMNIQVSKYLTSAPLTDRLSSVCMMSKSNNLNTTADLMPHTENIGDGIDVIGPTHKDQLLANDMVDEMEHILNIAKDAYKYIVIDTSCGVWNKSSKKVLEVCDVVVICLPQDKFSMVKFREEDPEMYNPIFKHKKLVYVSALHYEYDHFGMSQVKKVLGEKIFPISLNDIVHKSLHNRNVLEFIKSEIAKKKPDDIIYELEDIVHNITKDLWDEEEEEKSEQGSGLFKWQRNRK